MTSNGQTYTQGLPMVFVRFPQNDPEGAAQYLVPGLSNKQYGFMKEVHVDADPAAVMTLLGPDADMVAFTGNKISRLRKSKKGQESLFTACPSYATLPAMARRLRVAAGGVVYHVLNRAVGRNRIFDDEGDYLAFEKVLLQAHGCSAMPLLAYCVMPNHWHLVVSPRKDGELSHYLRWLSVTHTQRWHARRGSAGTGPLYQGRFKSFPIQEDKHFLLVCRYVERNPVRAGLSTKAAGWR